MRKVKGIPVWLVVVILVAVALGVVAAYILASINISVKVEEPLSVVWHPESLSLYPNMTEPFNITVNNSAPVNYLVSLTLSLNDTAYQQAYVTFSNTTYGVIPGLNNLTAWISVAADAPPASLALTVELSRVSEVQPTFGYTFTWSNETQSLVNGTLTMKLNFALTQENLLITAQVNDTGPFGYYDTGTHLGLVFDSEFDGFHEGDTGLMFFPGNTYYGRDENELTPAWFLRGTVYMLPSPSEYHNCTFSNSTGYTFNIKLPRTVVSQKEYYSNKTLRVHCDFVSWCWRKQPEYTTYDRYFSFAWVYADFSFENYPFGVPT